MNWSCFFDLLSLAMLWIWRHRTGVQLLLLLYQSWIHSDLHTIMLAYLFSFCVSFLFFFFSFFLLSEQNDGCKNPKHKNLNPMTHNWFCVNEAIYSPEKNDCCIHCFGMVLFILDMGPDYFEWGWKVRFLDLLFRWQCLGKKNSCLLSNSQCTLWIFEIDKLCSCVLRTTFLMSE